MITARRPADPAGTGSSSAISRIVEAQQAWAAGYAGTGVDVAVIDTGVAPVTGLNTPGKVLTGPDLSLDAAVGAAAGLDAYGHGRRPRLRLSRSAPARASTAAPAGTLGMGMGTGYGQVGDRREGHRISR
jgi:serine protease AprX